MLKSVSRTVLIIETPASRLFAEPFVQAPIKENIKASRHWPLWIPIIKCNNAENVSIWWCHHVYNSINHTERERMISMPCARLTVPLNRYCYRCQDIQYKVFIEPSIWDIVHHHPTKINGFCEGGLDTLERHTGELIIHMREGVWMDNIIHPYPFTHMTFIYIYIYSVYVVDVVSILPRECSTQWCGAFNR